MFWVYVTWVIRDFGSTQWFHSLLHAIEEQDTQNRIEINIHSTAKIKEGNMASIIFRMWVLRRTRSRLLGLRCSEGQIGIACLDRWLRNIPRRMLEWRDVGVREAYHMESYLSGDAKSPIHNMLAIDPARQITIPETTQHPFT